MLTKSPQKLSIIISMFWQLFSITQQCTMFQCLNVYKFSQQKQKIVVLFMELWSWCALRTSVLKCYVLEDLYLCNFSKIRVEFFGLLYFTILVYFPCFFHNSSQKERIHQNILGDIFPRKIFLDWESYFKRTKNIFYRNQSSKLPQLNDQIYLVTSLTIRQGFCKKTFSNLSRHLFLDNILKHKNKHKNEHLTPNIAQRRMISFTVSHVGGILMIITFPPTWVSFIGSSVGIGKVWPFFSILKYLEYISIQGTCRDLGGNDC